MGDRTPAERLHRAVARIRETTAGREHTGIDHDSADDTVGTIATDDAVGFDPMPLLSAIDDAGVDVVAIGQIAAILHGSEELTGDLDLLWSGSADRAGPLAAAFVAQNAELLDDDDRPVPTDAAAFALPKVLFRTDSACGDLCTPKLPWGDIDVAEFIERADSCDIDGVRVRYLRVEDLQTMRRAVGRPKDLRRVAELDALRAD